jgi:hypothetical protein
MRRLTLLLIVGLGSNWLYAQVGEVTSEEIVIEKDKEIVLPKADKLYLPVVPPDLTRDSIRLNFNLASPTFNIGPYQPAVSPFAYSVPVAKLGYQNFVKAGYGNYGSPVITAYVGQDDTQFSWGAWAHHESFASGSVRERQSASSTTMLDIFGTFQNNNWAVTPALGWQSDGYRFYGYGNGDARITNDRATLERVRVSATLEELTDNKWSLILKPTLQTTNQNVPSDLPSSSENYFDVSAETSFKIDSTFTLGTNVQMGAISFKSPETINRNFMRLNPWVGFRKSMLFIKAGFEVASTNDTLVTGTGGYFYPDLSAEWSGLPGWTVYSALKGELRPVTFNSLTQENYFLDDTLTMVHENVKTKFTGGIRGAVGSRIFLNTGFHLSGVQNMSFFVPSENDSARFTILVDTKTTTIFNWFGSVNWQPASNTHLSLSADLYNYSLNELSEAWNRPTFKMSLEWFQRYSDRITSQARLTSLGGIKAPQPITFTEEQLDAIVDLSVQGNYQINDRMEGFVQLQNVFGQPYQRYLNYPNRGLQLRIGALYRF